MDNLIVRFQQKKIREKQENEMKLGRLRGEFEDPSPVPVQWSLSLFRFDGPASRTMAVFLGFVGRV